MFFARSVTSEVTLNIQQMKSFKKIITSQHLFAKNLRPRARNLSLCNKYANYRR
jgi:hypothetical protein